MDVVLDIYQTSLTTREKRSLHNPLSVHQQEIKKIIRINVL